MKFTIEIELDKETQKYVVFCHEMAGVSSFGETVPEAFRMIGDALATFWETLEELGEVEDFLDASGIECNL